MVNEEVSELKLMKSEEFESVQCDFYGDGSDYYMTREQIGAALGYANPQKAVGNLHNAHKERMDRYSFLESRNGRNIYFYNRKGIMELCRWSQQAKADAFMDFCWEVIDSLMRGEAKLVLPQDYPSALRALADSEERRLALESANVNLSTENEVMRPKALFADAVTAAKNSILVGEMAKLLKQNGVDMGQNRLFDWLRENGYLIRRQGADYNMPTQRSMEMGLFEIKETVIAHSGGYTTINKTPKITGKGQAYFANIFLS